MDFLISGITSITPQQIVMYVIGAVQMCIRDRPYAVSLYVPYQDLPYNGYDSRRLPAHRSDENGNQSFQCPQVFPEVRSVHTAYRFLLKSLRNNCSCARSLRRTCLLYTSLCGKFVRIIKVPGSVELICFSGNSQLLI